MTVAAEPVAATRLMTAEELLELPDDHLRHELVRGELTTMPPAGYPHGKVALHTGALIDAFVHEHHLGAAFAAETGFTLGRNPDTVRAPDVAFIATARIPAPEDARGFVEIAPDLVVEVLSPDDRPGAVAEKVLEWLEAGCRQVWVLDPQLRRVVVHLPDGLSRTLGEDDELDGGDVLPGFRVPVAELFS